MAIGPVQLVVLGFNQPDFHGEIIAELERLREYDMVRVIDSLVVYKGTEGALEVEHISNITKDEAIELGSKIGALIGLGIEGEEGAEAGAEAGAEEVAAQGEIEVEHLSNLTQEEAIEIGSKVGALIGLGIEGEEGMEAGAVAGAEEAAEQGINVFGDADEWDVLEDIPNDSAAALILLEHHWAVPLRDAIARAGGFRLSDGFISPLDLVAIGLMTAEEAKDLHAMETASAASSK